MATVRIPVSPEVQAPTNAAPYQSARGATPEAFGAGIGEAVQGLGRQIGRMGDVLFEAALKRKDTADELMVADATTQMMMRMNEVWGGYSGRLGRSAQDELGAYQQSLQTEFAAILDTMPDDNTRSLFARQGQTMLRSFLGYGQNHANEQFRTWQRTSAQGRAEQLQAQAVLAANANDGSMEALITGGADEIRKYNEAMGLDPDTVLNAVTEYKGGTYKFVIKTLLEQGNYTRAQQIYDTHRADIDAKSAVEIETALSGPRNDLTEEAVVNTIVGQRPGDSLGGPPRPAVSWEPVPWPSYMRQEQIGRIATVDVRLQQVMARAAQISSVQFYVPPHGALRDQAQQAEMVRRGWSKTMNSNHLHGAALDIWPVRGTTPDANWDEGYAEIHRAMLQAASELGVEIEWGGNWRSFVDKPHWQLARLVGDESGFAPQVINVPANLVPIFQQAEWNFPDIPKNLLASMAAVESGGFRADVISGEVRSSAGAVGLMQFKPGTAQQYRVNPTDPQSAVFGAATYLRDLYKMFEQGRSPEEAWRYAVMAYNWGPGNMQDWLKNGADPAKVPAETRDYIQKVFGAGGMQRSQVAPTGGYMTPGQQAGFNNVMQYMQEQQQGWPGTQEPTDNIFPRAPTQPPPDVAPVEYGMPDKDEAMRKLLQMLADQPERIPGATAKLNRRYSEFETQTASERRDMDETVKNMMTAAVDGVPNLEFPEDRVRYLYQPSKAESIISEFRVAEQIGRMSQAIMFASPQEVAAAEADMNSGFGAVSQVIRRSLGRPAAPGTPEAATQDTAYYRLLALGREKFNARLAQRQAALFGPNADPAAFARQAPAVQQAAEKLEREPTAENLQRFWSAQLGTQDHLGIPPAQQRVLTRSEAQQAALSLLDPAKDAAMLLQQRREMAGSLWNNYLNDVVEIGGLPPSYEMIALLPTAQDQSLLSKTLREFVARDDKSKSWDDFVDTAAVGAPTGLFGQSGSFVKNGARMLRDAIAADPSVGRYLNSLRLSGAPYDQLLQIQDAINILGYGFMLHQKQDAATAAESAVNAFLGQYDFMPSETGGAVVPAPLRDQIAGDAEWLLQQINPKELLPSTIVGQQAMPSVDAWWAQITAAPTWITNEDANGIYLADAGGNAVRWRDGRRIEVMFEQRPAGREAALEQAREDVNELRRGQQQFFDILNESVPADPSRPTENRQSAPALFFPSGPG